MSEPRRVLLVGWDSADWKVINPLMDEGKMPHVQQLLEGGVMGNLATLYPILSPMLWTSIATGKRAHKHGIHGFTEPDPMVGGVRPITNLSRKTKALWNILSQSGRKCIVVGWWPSHPAEPLPDGVMISNQFQRAPSTDPSQPWPMPRGTVHPARLVEPLGEMRIHPAELDASHFLPFVPDGAKIDQSKDRRLESLAQTMADCSGIQAAATSLIDSEPWDFMAVYFDAIDHFGHGFMRYHPPRQKGVSKKDFDMYRGVIETGYRYHDLMLGVLMAKAGPDTTVLLMSDHGFHPDHLRPRAIPVEPAGPAIEHRHYGIFALRGPGIKKDERVYGATVLDICPTVLTLFGLPVGRDMDGKTLVSAWETTPQVETVPSWDEMAGEDGGHPPGTHLSAEDSREALRQLEDLGYIQPLPEEAGQAVVESVRELRYNLACSYTDAQLPSAAAGIFADLWEEAPSEHRFGVKLLSSQLSVGRHAEARRTLAKLRERQKTFASEAAELLKKRREEWKDRQPEDLKPVEKFEMRRLTALAMAAPANTWQLEALLLVAEGNPAEALVLMEKMEKAGKGRPEFYLHLGHAHQALKQWKEAGKAFRKALKLDPDNAHAHLAMAQVCLANRRDFDAAGFALKATGLLYHYPSAHFTLGVALHRLGFLERAVEALRVCANQNPNFLPAHRQLVTIYGNRLKKPDLAEEHRRKISGIIERARERQNAPVIDPVLADPYKIQTAPTIVPPPEPAFDPTVLAAPYPGVSFATIVSGLPRSGTSLMMQILAAGGLPPLHDGHRAADEDNPRGYFEFAPAKNLRMDGTWMSHARGRVLKLVAQLVPFLPRDHEYRIILMERPLQEVLASQRTMLDRHRRQGAALSDDRLEAVYRRQLEIVDRTIEHLQFPVLRIAYSDIIAHPHDAVRQIAGFLALPLQPDAMAQAVDPSLYRQRVGRQEPPRKLGK